MKKILLACLFLYLGYVGFQDWKAGNAVQYVSPEGSKERVAENIIRDKLGTITNWADENKKARVISVQSIPQVQTGKLALDFRVRFDDTISENAFIHTLLWRAGRECLASLLNDENLKDYDEFRLYGAVNMSGSNGKSNEEFVAKLFMNRAMGEKFNWDRSPKELHSALMKLNGTDDCTYWVHGGILSRADDYK